MIPFLLVHEMLLNMVSKGGNRLGQLAELLPDSPLFNLRKAFCVKNHLDWMKTIAIGFHGDGVPHSKKGSAQVFFIGTYSANRQPIVFFYVYS